MNFEYFNSRSISPDQFVDSIKLPSVSKSAHKRNTVGIRSTALNNETERFRQQREPPRKVGMP